MAPRLTIGMPVRNGARHLPATLDSLLAQSWGDFEVVISDNASDDGTADIAESYAAQDARVRVLRQERNIGANENYNVVARRSAELFKWSAHDDLCAPDYLRTCVGLLDADADTVMTHTEPLLIDVDGQPLRPAGDHYQQPDGVPVRRPDPPLAARGLSSAAPADRFAGVLLHTAWVFEIFGVMRASAMRETALHEPFYGTDKVFVAEIALRGKIVGSEEPLWLRRCHGGATTNLDLLTRARWSSPGQRPVPPSLQMLHGYSRALRRAPLSSRDRLACYGVLARKVATMRAGTLAAELAETRAARRATAQTG